MFGVCAGVLCGYSMKECGRIVAVEVEVCGWFAVCGLRLRCERVFFVCELQYGMERDGDARVESVKNGTRRDLEHVGFNGG